MRLWDPWLMGHGSYAAPLQLKTLSETYCHCRWVTWLFKIFKFVQGTILWTPLKPCSCGLYKLSLPPLPSTLHNLFTNHNHILDPPAHPNRTHKAQHNLSLVRSITSVFSAHFRLPICFSLANNLSTAITIRRTPFTVRQARSISIFGSSTILPPQKYQKLLAAILHQLRDYLNPPKKQPLSDPSTTPHPDHYYNSSLKGWSHFWKIRVL